MIAYTFEHTVFAVISPPVLINAPPHISHLIDLIFPNMSVFKASFYDKFYNDFFKTVSVLYLQEMLT